MKTEDLLQRIDEKIAAVVDAKHSLKVLLIGEAAADGGKPIPERVRDACPEAMAKLARLEEHTHQWYEIRGIVAGQRPAQPAKAPQQIQHSSIGRRPAKDDLERWAAAGLKKLAGLDSDGAQDLNGEGFSKHDTEIGHSLARQAGSMTPKQWETAVRIARKYHRQIGEAPTLELTQKEAR